MRIHDGRILDELGRTLILRGLNLGGDSKVPVGLLCGAPGGEYSGGPPRGSPDDPLGSSAALSFVGRPFPLEEAEGRFEQLASWGFTFIRLLITWEALEHQGPGVYDEAYLAYLRKLLLAAEKWGISVYIDPHQDVWSRFTGGDGAPAWTLEGLGMRPELVDDTGAAVTWGRYGEFHGGRPCPPMIWPSNYNRYAAATMFTLFFAGDTYAPDLRIGEEGVQGWLQGRYIAAMRHCYRRLKNCPAIVGWGAMNEPSPGFVGHRDLASPEKPLIPLGPAPSPFQTMLAASGYRVEAPVYGITPLGRRVTGREILNPQGRSLFRAPYSCPWKQAGVWDEQGGRGRLLRKDHFARYQGRPPRFEDDFLKPFMIKFIESMREGRRETLFFVEGIPNGGHPGWTEKDPPNTVNAFHWYDGFSLFTRIFRPWFNINTGTGFPVIGRKAVAAYYREALGKALAWTRENMGNMPCLLGEFGIPYNMNGGRAYRTGDYSLQEEALALYYDAIDGAHLHSTIWNYSAAHNREDGDGWNGEDLSIVTRAAGGGALGRAMAGWLRPYPAAVAGRLLSYRWDWKRGVFSCRYRAEAGIKAPTKVFLPGQYLGRPEIRWERPAAPPRVEFRPAGAGERETKGEAGGLTESRDSVDAQVPVETQGSTGTGGPAGLWLLIYHEDYGGEVSFQVRQGADQRDRG